MWSRFLRFMSLADGEVWSGNAGFGTGALDPNSGLLLISPFDHARETQSTARSLCLRYILTYWKSTTRIANRMSATVPRKEQQTAVKWGELHQAVDPQDDEVGGEVWRVGEAFLAAVAAFHHGWDSSRIRFPPLLKSILAPLGLTRSSSR
ncbi:hypothetical protein K438DRAFT_1757648 [Mycena galopus ATCC 62051]|nr:hypothetical protein K438DRAFT_1757648 [Mycena galopus ATCC 62051]